MFVGAISGGAGAELSGGNFWQGAAIGLTVGLLNHAGQSFITAMATSVAGDAFGVIGGKAGEYAHSVVGHSLFGAVVGGVVSNMQGGNFWEGATIGLTVSLLNHAMHKMDNNMFEDDDQQQQGKAVTRKSLGITSKDTREDMISKVLKNMKVGDYITGDEASFLGDASKSYIKTVTRTGKSTFSVDGKSNWGISVFKSGSTISISQQTIRGSTSAYNVNISGLTGTAKTFNVPSSSYIDGNTTYVTQNNKWFTIK